MKAAILSKKETQSIIKALKSAGLPAIKIDGGYELKDKDGNIHFKAMQGKNNYLVRYNENLISKK